MDPFIGQIALFAGNFAPRGWALCDGQLLQIASNSALFSILGTTYGGDGRTTFGLPDLRGRAPIHPGSGPGLTVRNLGQKGGVEAVTLSDAQMPAHGHGVKASGANGTTTDPTNAYPAKIIASADVIINSYAATENALMNAAMIASTGGGASHGNMQPFLGLNYIIALVGVYPSRN